jgi:radical SAM superfamily enzyme
VTLLVAESSEEWILIVADQLRSTSRRIIPKQMCTDANRKSMALA